MTSAAGAERGLGRDGAVVLGGIIALFLITAAWWALAFWPVQEGPAWLARTRYVCFGVSDSGLPDTGGWVGLIAGPLGMLAILTTGWWNGVRQLARSARTSPAVAVVLAALAVGSSAIVLGAAMRVQAAQTFAPGLSTQEDLPSSTYPRLDRAAPPLELIGHDGKARGLDELKGRTVFVTFGFAHCETICPLVVRNTLSAREQLAREGTAVAVLIVTLDPWRDTPARLASMAASWSLPADGAWVLGGTVSDVNATLDAWNVPRSRDLATGEVTHPSLVYVIDPDGRIAFVSTGSTYALASLARRL